MSIRSVVTLLPAFHSRLRLLVLVLILFSNLAPSFALPRHSDLVTSPPTPPAVFYGEILAGGTFTPASDLPITARIDGQLCGESVTQEDGGQIVYVIDVLAASDENEHTCGVIGRIVTFFVDAQAMAPVAIWDDSQFWYVPLEPMQISFSPVVAITQDVDDLLLTWSEVTNDLNNNATFILQYEVWRNTKPYFNPDQPGCDCTLIASVSDTQFLDSDDLGVDIVGDPTTNYYYLVRAVNAEGVSLPSGQVAAFDFALVTQ